MVGMVYFHLLVMMMGIFMMMVMVIGYGDKYNTSDILLIVRVFRLLG